MMSESEVNWRCMSLKLEFLEEQRGHMHKVVDDYVSMVIGAGKLWAESEERHRPKFLEMFQMIENAVGFFRVKYEELSDGTTDGTLKLSQSFAGVSAAASEKPGQILSALTAMVAKKESAVLVGTTGALAGCSQSAIAEAAMSLSQNVIPGQAIADEAVLRDVLARVGALEDVMHSLHVRTEDIVTKHTGIHKKVEEMSKKQSEVDKKISDVASKCNKSKNEQNKMLSEIKGEIGKFAHKQNTIQKFTTMHQHLKEQLELISLKQYEMEDYNCSKMNILEDLKMQVVAVNTETEYMKSQFHSLQSALGESVSVVTDVSTKTNSLETVTEDLSEQVRKSLETLEIISASQEKHALTQKGEFEVLVKDKLILAETAFQKELREVHKQLKETESNYKTLCQMLDNRLQPLEQLRHTLNDRSKARDENVMKLQEVVKEVAAISPRITDLEMQSSSPVVGFSARASNVQNFTLGSVITNYHHFCCNIGGHFDPSTGIFTAPLDGLYFVSISVPYYKNYNSIFAVTCKDSNTLMRKNVCYLVANENMIQNYEVSLVEMKTDETLLLQVIILSKTTDHNVDISFSCFRIG